MKKKILIVVLILLLTLSGIIYFTIFKGNNNSKLQTVNNINLSGTGIIEYEYDGKIIESDINNGDFKKVLPILINSYKKNNNNTNTLRLLGVYYSKKGEYESALKYLIKLNDVTNESNSQYLYDLGVVYSALGNMLEAKKYISKAIDINPDNKFAIDYLKNVIEKNGF